MTKENLNWLILANSYSALNSGCKKVTVGSAIVKHGKLLALGANKTFPVSCRDHGCLRIEKYGENSKLHRNPEDCRAVHSEIDAICSSKTDLYGATIYVTRYPCEACARAIVDAGIKRVVYGRQQEISEETYNIFKAGKVLVYHEKEWDAPDVWL